jgi:hypothetical protein
VPHDRAGLHKADMFDRFRGWAAAAPKDVGIQTRAVLDDIAALRADGRQVLVHCVGGITRYIVGSQRCRRRLGGEGQGVVAVSRRCQWRRG